MIAVIAKYQFSMEKLQTKTARVNIYAKAPEATPPEGAERNKLAQACEAWVEDKNTKPCRATLGLRRSNKKFGTARYLAMALKLTHSYLEDSLTLFRFYKRLAEGAMQQVSDAQLVEVLDPEMNSIAVIAKHMAGNMRSRWVDFLTSDGEKPDRNRDSEFEAPPASREELMSMWEQGWHGLFAALEPLTDADMTRTVTIRGEAHSVMQAINRQIAHYAYHCGQIVFLAKHFQSANWKSLSVPRGKSDEFSRSVLQGKVSQR